MIIEEGLKTTEVSQIIIGSQMMIGMILIEIMIQIQIEGMMIEGMMIVEDVEGKADEIFETFS